MNPTSIESKLISVRDGSVTPVKMQQKQRGVYEIEFVPTNSIEMSSKCCCLWYQWIIDLL